MFERILINFNNHDVLIEMRLILPYNVSALCYN